MMRRRASGCARRATRPAALVAVVVLLAGCAGLSRSPQGFIGDEVTPEPIAGREDAGLWVNPSLTATDAERYSGVMIDPIALWYSPTSPYQGIHPEELKVLTDYLHRAVVVELADLLVITDQPGEDTLQLRIAITDLVRERPSRVLTQRPGGLALSGVRARHGPTVLSEQELLEASSFFLAGRLEAELLDSTTGERLGAYVESRDARRGEADDGAATWGEVRGALDEWAAAIRGQLETQIRRLKTP
jgi:hypothetical protein